LLPLPGIFPGALLDFDFAMFSPGKKIPAEAGLEG